MKQEKKTLSLVLLFGGILWLGASGFAGAQEKERSRRQGPPDPDAMFERFDANDDGVLTKDELPERAQKRFERMDMNDDGQVSRDELGRRGEGERDPEARFKRHDSNGDGLLSVDELPEERGARMIEKLDEDGDGALSREEMAAGERGRREGKKVVVKGSRIHRVSSFNELAAAGGLAVDDITAALLHRELTRASSISNQ